MAWIEEKFVENSTNYVRNQKFNNKSNGKSLQYFADESLVTNMLWQSQKKLEYR
jgi:hypothetical protein